MLKCMECNKALPPEVATKYEKRFMHPRHATIVGEAEKDRWREHLKCADCVNRRLGKHAPRLNNGT
jgi:hypothetical protein